MKHSELRHQPRHVNPRIQDLMACFLLGLLLSESFPLEFFLQEVFLSASFLLELLVWESYPLERSQSVIFLSERFASGNILLLGTTHGQ